MSNHGTFKKLKNYIPINKTTKEIREIASKTKELYLAIQEAVNAGELAITAEETAREIAISAEREARETANNKMGFILTGEAKGILVANSYPFSFGMGNHSEPGFGIPIPFQYTLRGLAYSCVSLDNNPSITIKVLHYPFGNSTPEPLYLPIIFTGKHTSTILSQPASSAGNLVIEIISVSGLTDDNSKFRLSFIVTSDVSLYPPAQILL